MSLPATKCLVFALCWTLQFALEAEETLRGQFALEAEETLRAAVTAADEKVAEAEEAVEAAEAAAAEKAAEAEVALVEAHRAAVAGLEEQHSRAIAQNEAAAATLTAEWEAKLLVKERENQAAAAGHSTELATQVRLFGLLCFQCVCLSQEPDRVALTPNTLTPPGGLDQAKEHQSDFAAQAREHQKELAAQAKDHQKLVHAHSASEMALAKKQVLSAAFRLPFSLPFSDLSLPLQAGRLTKAAEHDWQTAALQVTINLRAYSCARLGNGPPPRRICELSSSHVFDGGAAEGTRQYDREAAGGARGGVDDRGGGVEGEGGGGGGRAEVAAAGAAGGVGGAEVGVGGEDRVVRVGAGGSRSGAGGRAWGHRGAEHSGCRPAGGGGGGGRGG